MQSGRWQAEIYKALVEEEDENEDEEDLRGTER